MTRYRASFCLLLGCFAVPIGPSQAAPPQHQAQQTQDSVKKYTLDTATDLLSKQQYAAALRLLDRVPRLRSDPDIVAMREEVVAADDKSRPARLAAAAKERANRAKQEEAAAKAARVVYAKTLRDHFLDDGLDIKVAVKGSQADRLELRFALFNDVWTHKFEKGDLVDEIRRMGFKRIDFNNDYDYHVYYDLR